MPNRTVQVYSCSKYSHFQVTQEHCWVFGSITTNPSVRAHVQVKIQKPGQGSPANLVPAWAEQELLCPYVGLGIQPQDAKEKGATSNPAQNLHALLMNVSGWQISQIDPKGHL